MIRIKIAKQQIDRSIILPGMLMVFLAGTGAARCAAQDFLIDSYGTVTSLEERGRLDNLWIQMRKQPDTVAYVLIRYRKGMSPLVLSKRKKRIIDYLTHRGKIRRERIKLIDEVSRATETRIYLLPMSEELPETWKSKQ